jgi:hypothetical protein
LYRYINETATDPTMEKYDFSDVYIDQDVLYFVGTIITDYSSAVNPLLVAMSPYDYSFLWKQRLDTNSLAKAFSIARDTEFQDIVYISGVAFSDLYDSDYDPDAITGGNAFTIAFDLQLQSQIWTQQWTRKYKRSQMAVVDAVFGESGLLYMVEYALSKGPAFITTLSRNGTVRGDLEIRYTGWQFVTAAGIVLSPRTSIGYVAGAYGRTFPNNGYLSAFNCKLFEFKLI